MNERGITLDADGGHAESVPRAMFEAALADEQKLMKSLLHRGATITEMNCVRKNLSMVRGERLALAAAPARVVTLVIAGIPGEDPSTVASGPTVPDATTRELAIDILARYRVDVPGPVLRCMIANALPHPRKRARSRRKAISGLSM